MNKPLRIVFCTRGGIPGSIVLDRLLQNPEFQVCGLVLSSRILTKSSGFFSGAWRMFWKTGIPYTIFIWLVAPVAEHLGILGGQNSTTRTAKRKQIPVLRTRNLNTPDGIQFLKTLSPDLLLCAHFDQILSPELCDGNCFAAVNIHPSILPAYRGVDPVFHTLLENSDAFGVTVHRLVPEVDSGKILASRQLLPPDSGSVLGGSIALFCEGAELVSNLGKSLLDPNAGEPQPAGGSYNGWPTNSEVLALYRNKRCLLRLRELQYLWKNPV